MNTPAAELFVRSVIELRTQGIIDDVTLIQKLAPAFNADPEDVEWWLEMLSTGSFRAAMAIRGLKMPKSNIRIEDEPVMEAAFRLYWHEQKGERDYKLNHFYRGRPLHKIWYRLFG